MVSFRDLQTQEDVGQYQVRLASGYPQRPAIVEHIVEQVVQRGIHEPAVAELCIGPGLLASALCRDIPRIRYVGLDLRQLFIDYTAARLPTGVETSFVRADLTGDGWPGLLTSQVGTGRFDAIVSMQSLHDVGDHYQTADIYHRCRALLADGGLFVNADLVAQDGEATPRPGRLTVARHLELLQAAGFGEVACSLRTGEFGCCRGVAG